MILSQHHEGGKEDLITCEKVANIIKQFKLTCNKVGANFNSIEVSTSNFTCLIMEFTKTENILIIYKNPVLTSDMISLNVSNLGKYFDIKKKEHAEKELQ